MPTVEDGSLARRFWHWFFPPRVELSPAMRALVAAVHPRLDLRRVRIYRGMPHVLSWIPNQGITLPHLWLPGTVCIYLSRRAWPPRTARGVGLLLHEALHARQAQVCGRGLSLGPWRPFVMLYLAAWGGNRFRYAGHPMELAAYRLAGRKGSGFDGWCAGVRKETRDKLMWDQPLATEELEGLCSVCKPPEQERQDALLGRGLPRSLPGQAPCARALGRLGLPGRLVGTFVAIISSLVWGLVWSLVAGLLWLAEVVVEAVGLVLAGPGYLWFRAVRRSRGLSD